MLLWSNMTGFWAGKPVYRKKLSRRTIDVRNHVARWEGRWKKLLPCFLLAFWLPVSLELCEFTYIALDSVSYTDILLSSYI